MKKPKAKQPETDPEKLVADESKRVSGSTINIFNGREEKQAKQEVTPKPEKQPEKKTGIDWKAVGGVILIVGLTAIGVGVYTQGKDLGE